MVQQPEDRYPGPRSDPRIAHRRLAVVPFVTGLLTRNRRYLCELAGRNHWDIRRCPVPCPMRRRPAGTAAVPGRPTTPRTIGAQRLAAPLTGTRADGFRARLNALTGRPEQLVRRAAGRPAVGHHPTGQIPTGRQHDRRRDRRHGLGQQRTHLRDVAMTHPAQQLGGRQRARIEPGLRVPRVRAERLDHGDRRPGRRRGLRAPPRQPRRRDRHPRNCYGRTADPRTATAYPPRYSPNAAARPINASRVGPSCPDTRHVGRSHPTKTLTCASSDNTVDHALRGAWTVTESISALLAPSDRFTPAPFVRRNEMILGCNVNTRACQTARRPPDPPTRPGC